MPAARGLVQDEFQTYVRPIVEPKLSRFCTTLTSITQRDVDAAETFPKAFARFMQWAGDADFTWCSWGDYDLGQLRLDCRRHALAFPPVLERHINLKKEFARIRNVHPRGMSKALKLAGLKLQGTHHRALDDARNIATLAMLILPGLAAPPPE